MAIKYYNSIDLLQNELIQPRVQNEISDAAAGSGVDGQIYFNTTSNTLKVWITSAWYNVPSAGTGFVNTVTTGNSTFINLVDSGTAADPILTASLSATGTPSSSTYLRGDNSWATITDINTTYDLFSYGSTNGTVGIELVGSDATTDQVAITGAGTTSVTNSGTVITITSNDQYTGTVTSVDAGSTTFISGSGGPITTSGSLSYSLSATGTPSSSTYLRGDNTWAALPGPATITLTGEVTGSGTTSISTTVANGVLDIDNFTAATIVTESEGIANNDNDTTLPTSAAVKDYVDNAIVGGLVYQGGYDAATNTPDLDVSPSASIRKGWTYTVTADGSFFTEQVRVGDVLIAEIDSPTTLADWTTVQNNIDLASLTQVGIGNVNAGTGIGVSYSSGTATVSNTGVTSLIAGEGIDVSAATGAVTVSGEDSSATNKGIVIVAGGTGISVSYASGTATVTNTETNAANTYATTISATATITHNLGTRDVVIQLYDTVTYETVYADVVRTNTTQATITFANTPANSIRVLVQKIG